MVLTMPALGAMPPLAQRTLRDFVVQRLNPTPTAYTPQDFGIELRGAGAKLFACRDQEVLLDGPAGTGKTIAALWYMHLLAANNPGFLGLFARKTQTALASTALPAFRRHVLSVETFGAKFFGGNKEEPAAYRYPNGSRLVVGGLDKDTKIMSSEYDAVFVNEATELTEGDWESIISRLRAGTLPYQQVIADCNPQAPTHWLNKRADTYRTTRFLSRHEDNPRWFTRDGVMTEDGHAYIGGILDRLTGVRYKRLRLGQWVSAEGQVYEAWDNQRHVLDADEVHQWLERRPWFFGTADWGWVNPGCLQCWAVDRDGRMLLIAEHYHTQKTVEGWWVPKAVEFSREFGFLDWLCDPAEPQNIELFRRAGLNARGAINDIIPGITAVQERLAPAGDGRPRLFIAEHALRERDPALEAAKLPISTLQEIPEYVWDRRRTGDLVLKEKPVDANNHGMDTLRYAVAHLDLQGGVVRPLDPRLVAAWGSGAGNSWGRT